MVMYSLNGARPVPRLPHQFRYQGRLYSDPSQWYPAIGEAAGWAEVEDKPDHDPDTQHPATWNGTAWVVADLSVAERKTRMLAQARARYAEVADGGTTATIAEGVTIAVATETKPTLKLVRSAAYMADNSLSSMKVVTSAGASVDLTPSIAGVMLAAIDAFIAACEEAHNRLVTAINAAADATALGRINVQAGTVTSIVDEEEVVSEGWPS